MHTHFIDQSTLVLKKKKEEKGHMTNLREQNKKLFYEKIQIILNSRQMAFDSTIIIIKFD